MNWKPIKTAPKQKGKEVLLLVRNLSTDSGVEIVHAYWAGHFHLAFKSVGPLRFIDNPTHWSELPSNLPNEKAG